MKKKYAIAITGFVVVLTTLAILLGSCSMGQGDITSETGIRLSIGPDTPSRSLDVEVFDVTKVVVRIHIPGSDDHVIEWFDGDVPYSDFVPIAEPGTYQISVTHFGENDGGPVEITETADLPVYPMLITFVRIVPGMVGKIDIDPGPGEEPAPACDLVGIWEGNVDFPSPTGGLETVYSRLTVFDDGTIYVLSYQDGILSPMQSFQGNYSCDSYDVSGEWKYYTSNGIYWDFLTGWDTDEPQPISWWGKFTVVDGNLELQLRFMGPFEEPDQLDPDTTWYMTSAPHPCLTEDMFGVWGHYADFGAETIVYQKLVIEPNGRTTSIAFFTELTEMPADETAPPPDYIDLDGPPEEDMSFRGAVTRCDGDLFISYNDLMYGYGTWDNPIEPPEYWVTNIAVVDGGSTLEMILDWDGDLIPETPWVFTRLSP